jgi:hypothetical protein
MAQNVALAISYLIIIMFYFSSRYIMMATVIVNAENIKSLKTIKVANIMIKKYKVESLDA